MAEENEARPYIFVGSLHSNWSVSSELGAMLGEFAVTESLLVEILALVIKEEDTSHAISHQIFGQIQSVSLRIDILTEAAKVSDLQSAIKVNITAALQLARSNNTMRNKYAHGLYSTNVKTGKVYLKPFGTSTTRKNTSKKEITYTQVKKDRERTNYEQFKSAQAFVFGSYRANIDLKIASNTSLGHPIGISYSVATDQPASIILGVTSIFASSSCAGLSPSNLGLESGTSTR